MVLSLIQVRLPSGPIKGLSTLMGIISTLSHTAPYRLWSVSWRGNSNCFVLKELVVQQKKVQACLQIQAQNQLILIMSMEIVMITKRSTIMVSTQTRSSARMRKAIWSLMATMPIISIKRTSLLKRLQQRRQL